MKRTVLRAALVISALATFTSVVQAQDKAGSSSPPSWWDTFSISGHLDGGITFNTYPQNDGLNF
ncbi:MAG: porin, partial [Proteobacteria bacterium]|nr:porin [Pseudomonadota bacterium]